MPTPAEVLDQAIESSGNLRKVLKRGTNRQVQAVAERGLVKATALAWFNAQRPQLESYDGNEVLQTIDAGFQELLAAADRSTNRRKYDERLKILRERLIDFRSHVVERPPRTDTRADRPPDFTPLVRDADMRDVLNGRWSETQLCIEAGAYLAAAVMMGALLEALLLARVNVLTDKTPVFTASSAPRDKAGNTRPLSEWSLKNYIDVTHELGWIGRSAKDVGEVLRDYRNYIHPAKQLSHGITIDERDARMFWVVFKSLAEQVVASV